jgi:hypothetical protein
MKQVTPFVLLIVCIIGHDGAIFSGAFPILIHRVTVPNLTAATTWFIWIAGTPKAHPAEDFAETFAIWLRGPARWREDYQGWPALRKLEYIDQLMHSIAGMAPQIRSTRQVEPIRTLRYTLKEHYRRKRRRYATEWPEFFDRELKRLFTDNHQHPASKSAAAFLRKLRPQTRHDVAKWTGVPPYTIDQVVRDMIDRCLELNLKLHMTQRDARTHTMLMVTTQTMNFLHYGYPRIAL